MAPVSFLLSRVTTQVTAVWIRQGLPVFHAVICRPFGAGCIVIVVSPWLAPWAIFFRRSATGEWFGRGGRASLK
jgi:hypothetical protein